MTLLLATLKLTHSVCQDVAKTGRHLLPAGEIMAGLTDRKLQSLKPAAAGKHYDVWDRDGFGVRISDKGTKSFVLMVRYPGSANPAI